MHISWKYHFFTGNCVYTFRRLIIFWLWFLHVWSLERKNRFKCNYCYLYFIATLVIYIIWSTLLYNIVNTQRVKYHFFIFSYYLRRSKSQCVLIIVLSFHDKLIVKLRIKKYFFIILLSSPLSWLVLINFLIQFYIFFSFLIK